ncbi:MAG: hypothetical protein LBR60_09135 [Fibrobacter sp.]|jgi:hypothetical protein|nr:hypothetical protein [Fibrobacter sp.]
MSESPIEKKVPVKPANSKPKPKRNRPAKPFAKAPSTAKASTFSDSIADRLGEKLAAKLKKHPDDVIKRRIKEAQSDPKVQEASAKFGSN